MFFGGKKILGLDIGSSSIKAVELDHSSSGVRLQGFGFVPTPQRSISGSEIIEPEAIGLAIRKLISELKTKRKRVAVGLWGTSVVVKRVSMPPMDDKLLAEQVRWEAEQYIPFDINEVSLEYEKLKSSSNENLDVLLVAARNEVSSRYVEAISAGGVECSILDVNGFALANCFEYNYGRLPGQVALLNMGATVTNFVVLENGQVTFIRDIPVGGANFSHDIQNEMGVSAEEAESLKISASLGQQVPDDVHRILTSTTENMAQEVRNSFEFYSSSANSATISRIFLTGGCVSIPNIVGHIAKVAGASGELLDPLRNVIANPKRFNFEYLQQVRPFAAIAIGLGLRKEGDR